MIRDQNQNELEMVVEKKNGKVYLVEGSEVLRRFYKIFEGAWMSLVYVNRHLFLFELRNMHGEELFYPHFSPPHRILLQLQNAHDYRNSFIQYGSTAQFFPTKFSHLLAKELSKAEVMAGRMVRILWLMLNFLFSDKLCRFHYVWSMFTEVGIIVLKIGSDWPVELVWPGTDGCVGSSLLSDRPCY